MHQAQRDQGTNTLHLCLHIESLILLGAKNLHGAQSAGLLASCLRFRQTTYDVAPFF